MLLQKGFAVTTKEWSFVFCELKNLQKITSQGTVFQFLLQLHSVDFPMSCVADVAKYGRTKKIDKFFAKLFVYCKS